MTRHCRHEPTARKTIVADWLQGDDGFPLDLGEGPDYAAWWVRGVCEYGNCIELNCPVCGCNKGGWGPVDCPCDDTIGYHDMRRKPSVPIKPSVAGKRPGDRRSRKHR